MAIDCCGARLTPDIFTTRRISEGPATNSLAYASGYQRLESEDGGLQREQLVIPSFTEFLMQSLNSMSMKSNLFVLFSLGIFTMTGCGGPVLIKTQGKITVNGAPAVGAVLLFHPVDNKEAPVASGVAESDGSFTLTSNMNEGVPPGNYQVTVTWPDPAHKVSEAAKMRGDAEPGADLLKGKYVMKDKSGLTAQITSTTKELPPIEIKTK